MSIVSGTVGAILGSDAQEQSAETAADAQKQSADKAAKVTWDMFTRSLEEFKPYADLGKAAVPYLQSAVLGGKVLGADGAYHTFNPQESPAAKWELQQGTKAYNRALASRGLSGSGQAATGLRDLNSSIYANDYDKQYGRLVDLVKIGSGASGSAGAASQNTGNNLAGIYSNAGNNLSNLALMSGQAKAGLYSGLGAQSGNAMSNAYNAYKLYNAWNGASTGYQAGAAGSGYGYATSPEATESIYSAAMYA